ncbi:MAG: YfcE family phosphodiesterase [Nanohaloarchaea archaeon QH_8_44_6]|nr:MAG: YfcE family phosphodiesterase [Nanohaloarchaea archaeon QH_8_44_6]
MIAVISDSHIPKRAKDIPEKFYSILDEAETIVHCGDIVSKDFKEKIEQHGELVAVKGNCDRIDLEPSETFEKQGLKFGAYHGSGITPRGHHPTLVKTAETLSCDILFHGHSHKEEIVKEDGKILVNPGSCTGVGGGTAKPGNPTMAKIILEKGLKAQIIEKTDKGLKVQKEKIFQIR